MSEEPDERLKAHNGGKVFSTKAYRPWARVHIENYDTAKKARLREKYFKSGSGKERLKQILDLEG
jgi:putative endonuclease